MRARSSASPTAPKASDPSSAMSRREVICRSLPSREGCAAHAASQPTPTAARVPTIRHSPPMVGTGLSGASLSGCVPRAARCSSRSSGTIILPSAAVSTNPAPTRRPRRNESFFNLQIHAKGLFFGIFLLCVENFQHFFQRHAAACLHQQGIARLYPVQQSIRCLAVVVGMEGLDPLAAATTAVRFTFSP